ncbi:SDR family oxidoreductase [Saccharopolyspora shandongensis]|uniref:SDR family NAD(P)-dependent oxidoreductase n=1 Tax=Saccharopolyspora shandongensis TaxID=418495 RepID=UPI0033DFC096
MQNIKSHNGRVGVPSEVGVGSFGGKVAIITGAASVEPGGVNIGGAAAAELASCGARVVVASRTIENVERLAAMLNKKHGPGTALAVATDVRSENQVEQLVATAVSAFGGLHVLINVAGIFPVGDGDLASMSVDVWDDVMAVNLRGTMLATKYALPHLREVGGAIVNTASTHAFAGDSGLTAYGATKAAILALTAYTATQYGQEGVRCNAVCPGVTITPPALRLPAVMMGIYRRHVVAPELNGPEQLAKLYCFLASDDAGAINGEHVRADNGMLAQQPFVPDMRDLTRAAVPDELD